MAVRAVVVGGGPGGIVVANRLSFMAPHDWEIVLISDNKRFIFQTGWLRLALGEERPGPLAKPLKSLLQSRVQLILRACRKIDPESRSLVLDGQKVTYDFLVIATGCEPDPGQVEGLSEGAHHFHDQWSAVRLRQVLASFEGGRIVVGVGGFPYKCPPSPIEFTCLLHENLERRGLRDRTEIIYATPLPRVFHMEPLVPIFDERFDEYGIRLANFFTLERIIPGDRKAVSLDGQQLTADLFVMVPPHRGSQVIRQSGLGDSRGFLPVDRKTLKVTGWERVYALGDAADLPTPKALTAALKQGLIVAENILAEGQEKQLRAYGGQVGCLIDVGKGLATLATFDYENLPRPPAPTKAFYRAKRQLRKLILETLKMPL